jgi:hypothetical protein
MDTEFVRFADITDDSIRRQIFLDYLRGWESSLYQEADLGIIRIPEWSSIPGEEKNTMIMNVIEKQFDSASDMDPNSHWALLGRDNGSPFAFGSIRLQLIRMEDGIQGNWYDLSGNGFGHNGENGDYLVGYALQTTLDRARRIPRGFTIFINHVKDYAIKQGLGLGTLSPFSGKSKYDDDNGSIGIDDYVRVFIRPDEPSLRLPHIDAVRMHINKGAELLKDPGTDKYMIWTDYKKHPPSQNYGASTQYLPVPGPTY